MHGKGLVIGLSVVAVTSWLGLILFMNRKPPDTLNQVIFLLILGVAVSGTTIPVAFALLSRQPAFPGREVSLARPLRLGLLMGTLAMLLMALRFMRALNLIIAVLLVLLVAMVETLVSLRSH